ncbi:MAG: DUF5671 domain-containing protein [Pseudohongiellaceae bacterium]
MANTELNAFVKEALVAGSNKAEIKQVLLAAGWAEAKADSALSEFADTGFRVPVPAPKVQVSARDAFLYLVMFGMLYVSVYHFGRLVFDFLNIALPAPTDFQTSEMLGSSIRFSVASLIVAFPLFLYVSSRVLKLSRKDPAHRGSPIRKWLTYLTLALAVFVIVGDLIAVLYSLLSGELTLRFILKTLTILFLAGAVYWFCSTLISNDEEEVAR